MIIRPKLRFRDRPASESSPGFEAGSDMAKKKQEAESVPPEWTQIIRSKFLNYGRLSSPKSFNLLVTEVLKGSMTV